MPGTWKSTIARAVLAVWLGLGAAAPLVASVPGDEIVATYQVDHDHAIGSGRGELRITTTGFEYRGMSKDEARHSHVWRDEDVKRIDVERTKIKLTVYAAGSVPILPRQVPFVKETIAIPAGTEHDYEFHLRAGEIPRDVVGRLEARFPRPVETSVVPTDAESLGTLLFEIPVFHRERAGGHAGALRVYDRRVVFAADDTHDSRAWRYADVRSISSLGRFKFEVSTYEGQFGPGGRDYVFDLKRPMTDREYDALWSRMYEARSGTPDE